MSDRISQLSDSVARLQRDLAAARDDTGDDSSRMKAGDIRRWNSIRTPAEGRTMLKLLFTVAAADRERVRELERVVQDLRDEAEFFREERKARRSIRGRGA